jgi:putative chitinase
LSSCAKATISLNRIIITKLDENTLRRLWPQGDSRVPGLLSGMVQSSEAVFARSGITTPLFASRVVAQISHECGAGRDVVEI